KIKKIWTVQQVRHLMDWVTRIPAFEVGLNHRVRIKTVAIASLRSLPDLAQHRLHGFFAPSGDFLARKVLVFVIMKEAEAPRHRARQQRRESVRGPFLEDAWNLDNLSSLIFGDVRL